MYKYKRMKIILQENLSEIQLLFNYWEQINISVTQSASPMTDIQTGSSRKMVTSTWSTVTSQSSSLVSLTLLSLFDEYIQSNLMWVYNKQSTWFRMFEIVTKNPLQVRSSRKGAIR